MRIVHYHRELLLENGGVVRAVLDICTGLAEAGHDVTVLSPVIDDVPDAWKAHEPGVPRAIATPAPTIGGSGGWFSRRALRAIGDHLDGHDVLHLHGMWGAFNAQLARLARRRDLPYVYSVHGMLDDWCMAQRTPKKRLFLSLYGRASLHGAAAVHCTAQAELDQSKKWFPKGRGVVVPLILDTEPFRDLPGPEAARQRFPELTTERPALLFLSRLHYKKGIEHLIRAAALLRDRNPVVYVVGSGDDAYVASLKDLVRELDLESIVLFPGFVSGTEKISLYQAADLFVLPTSQENFGFVLFEALAAGTPLVTTRGADTWPEMEASGGAVISDAAPEPLARAIGTLLDDDERRAAMGAAGRAWVLEHLSAAAVVDEFTALYQRAAAGASPA